MLMVHYCRSSKCERPFLTKDTVGALRSKFNSKWPLDARDHLTFCHMGKKDYECGFCERRFGTRHVLVSHRNIYHPKEGTQWELKEMRATRNEEDLEMIDSMFKELIAIEQHPFETMATPVNIHRMPKKAEEPVAKQASAGTEVEVAGIDGHSLVTMTSPTNTNGMLQNSGAGESMAEQINIETETTVELGKPAERRKVKLLVDMEYTKKNKPPGYQLFYQTVALLKGCRTQSVGADNHFYILHKWEEISDSAKASWAFEESTIKTIRTLERATKQLNFEGNEPQVTTLDNLTQPEPLPDHLFSEGFKDFISYCPFTKQYVIT